MYLLMILWYERLKDNFFGFDLCRISDINRQPCIYNTLIKINRSGVFSCSNTIIFQKLHGNIHIHRCLLIIRAYLYCFLYIKTQDLSKPKQACVRRVRNRFFHFTSLFICWRSFVLYYILSLSSLYMPHSFCTWCATISHDVRRITVCICLFIISRSLFLAYFSIFWTNHCT